MIRLPNNREKNEEEKKKGVTIDLLQDALNKGTPDFQMHSAPLVIWRE